MSFHCRYYFTSLANFLYQYTVSTFRIQLVIFLWSLPLLLYWGIPLSVAMIVGNVIYGPIISVFLICCILLFITSFYGTSWSLFSETFDTIATKLFNLLSWGSPSWLFCLPKPHWLIAICIPLCVLIIMYYLKPRKITQEIIYLLLLATAIITLLSCMRDTNITQISQGSSSCYIIPHSAGKLALYDPHAALKGGNRLNSWIKFQLQPPLAKNYGATTCDSYIIKYPSERRLHTAAELLRAHIVRRIIIPEKAFDASWLQRWMAQNPEIVLVPASEDFIKQLDTIIEQQCFDKSKEPCDTELKFNL